MPKFPPAGECEVTFALVGQTPDHWNNSEVENTMATLSMIQVTIPKGAVVTRETLVVTMDIMALEAPGGVQLVDVELEVDDGVGGWVVQFTEDDVMSIPNADGGRDTLSMVCEVSGWYGVSGPGTMSVRAKVQQSLAKDTQYLYQGLYSIRYVAGGVGQ